MIQRIQSIYLFLTAILMAVTVISPLMTLEQTSTSSSILMDSLGFFSSNEPNITLNATWGLIGIAILAAILPLINIFLFKKRKAQLKVCSYTSIFIFLFYITLGVYFYIAQESLSLKFTGVDYGIILPFIALIFNLLARGKIKSDLKLIESLNRIR